MLKKAIYYTSKIFEKLTHQYDIGIQNSIFGLLLYACLLLISYFIDLSFLESAILFILWSILMVLIIIYLFCTHKRKSQYSKNTTLKFCYDNKGYTKVYETDGIWCQGTMNWSSIITKNETSFTKKFVFDIQYVSTKSSIVGLWMGNFVQYDWLPLNIKPLKAL